MMTSLKKFMKLLPGFHPTHSNQVFRLKKSLYGFRQAPHCWISKMSSALKICGFKQSYAKYSLFTYISGTIFVCVLVYGDDIITTGNASVAITQFKKHLNTCFHVKDLGFLKYSLGIEVAQTSSGLYLNQRKYVIDIISKTGLPRAKLVTTPVEQNRHLANDKGLFFSSHDQYHCLIGRFIYLTITRLELAYSVHILAQFM